MNRQQILSRLARHHDIVYSNGPWSVWDTRHAHFKRSSWIGRFERRDGVVIDQPPRVLLRWPTLPPLERLVMRLSVVRWRHELRRLGNGPVVAYVFHPVYGRLAEMMRPDLLVYSPYDMFSMMPTWSSEQEAEERRLLNSCDLVIASSEPTRSALQVLTSRPVFCVTNAADAEQFERGAKQPAPPDLAAIPHPRVGYVGSLNRKIDFRLLANLAKKEPSWQFVLIGPQGSFDDASREAFDECRHLPNFHVLPARPVTELPRCMGGLDVGLLCYRKDTWMDFGFPLKLFEYLAAGLPVISTPLQSILDRSDVVEIVDDEPGWHAAITRALDGRGRSTSEARREEARRNTWDSRVAMIDDLLQQALRGIPSPPPARAFGLNAG